MKVIIDGNENKFIYIFRPSGGSGYANHWQCNTLNHASAHNFNSHPSNLPKDQEIKINGHVYLFPKIVSKYPANEWVKPTNSNSNDYSVFADLFEWNLLERKIEPKYKGKQLVGTSHYFKYDACLITYLIIA